MLSNANLLVSCNANELGVAHVYLNYLARKPREREGLRLSLSILTSECSKNFILERNSFRNESHSGRII